MKILKSKENNIKTEHQLDEEIVNEEPKLVVEGDKDGIFEAFEGEEEGEEGEEGEGEEEIGVWGGDTGANTG